MREIKTLLRKAERSFDAAEALLLSEDRRFSRHGQVAISFATEALRADVIYPTRDTA